MVFIVKRNALALIQVRSMQRAGLCACKWVKDLEQQYWQNKKLKLCR